MLRPVAMPEVLLDWVHAPAQLCLRLLKQARCTVLPGYRRYDEKIEPLHGVVSALGTKWFHLGKLSLTVLVTRCGAPSTSPLRGFVFLCSDSFPFHRTDYCIRLWQTL